MAAKKIYKKIQNEATRIVWCCVRFGLFGGVWAGAAKKKHKKCWQNFVGGVSESTGFHFEEKLTAIFFLQFIIQFITMIFVELQFANENRIL